MSNWKSKLQSVFESTEDWFDKVRYRIKKFDKDVLITPYMGFGNVKKSYFAVV